MSRFGRDDKEELLDRRASVFSGLRVIVCDNETTGLNTTTSRIVSVALFEVQQGRVLAGYATLVDPGLSRIGASHIHHITAETLRRAQAPNFDVVGPRILEHLTARGDNVVVLAGYNVVFDALLLHNELRRSGSSLPPMKLLEVRTLAELADVAAGTLTDLAQALNIPTHDTHSSIGDTSVTTEALLRLTDRLRDADPDFRLEPLLVDFDPAMRVTRKGVRRGREEEEPLTPEHQAAHEVDLTHKTRREKALRTCIAERCVHLVARTQDGITDPVRARQVAEWVARQLDRDDLDRVTHARLVTAYTMAAGATGDGDYIKDCFDWLTPRLADWGPCTPGQQCDRCADDETDRTCRYTAVRYALVAAYLYVDDELSLDRAKEFLPHIPGDRRPHRGHPPTGWLGKLERSGDLDAAGYGAQLAAQAGPQARTPGHERRILAFAWDTKGSRNARLADRYSARILADGSPDPARPHLDQAEQVCLAALAERGDAKGRVYENLENRLARIRVRKANPPRQPPAYTRNKRPPRISAYQLT